MLARRCRRRAPPAPPEQQAVLELIEGLHAVVVRMIARGDWVNAVDALDALGDVHRCLGSPFTAATYRRARRMATRERVACAPAMREKWERELRKEDRDR